MDDGRPTGGERPAALLEPGPQGKMERHDGIAYEPVQALDAPVLQTVQFFATQLSVVAEPVIEVPKILPHDVPPRRWCRDTQLVEQLVEVPTPVSYSSLLKRTVEQHVDIPVPVGGGRGASVPRHVSSSTSSACGPRTWVDDDTGETWTLLTDPALGSWWYSLRTHRSQWHPPWER